MFHVKHSIEPIRDPRHLSCRPLPLGLTDFCQHQGQRRRRHSVDTTRLSQVIRARFKLFRRVKAITAEAKWSGAFLSVFPLLALVGINVLEPDYYKDVKDTEFFIPAALVVGVFLTVNVIFMKIMVNIKV